MNDTKWTRLDFPAEFRLGLEGLATNARWRIKRHGSSTLVATEERYLNQASRLLRLHRLADASKPADPGGYAPLTRWRPQDSYRENEMAARVQGLREIVDPSSATDALVSFRLQFMTIADADVEPFAREFYAQMATHLPRSSLWAIEFDPALSWRVAAVRMLFGAREHPDVLASVHEAGGRLPTPMGLLPSLGLGLDTFVEPLLLPLTPWVIGMNATRAGGQLIALFGHAMAGFSTAQADNPLELLRGRSPLSWTPPRPDHVDHASEAWLRWWVRQLNELLGMALDVGNFSDQSGRYDPGLQLGVLASLERVFASVQWILATASRPHGRVQTMFDVVDLFEGLAFGSWESMLRPDRTAKQMTSLEEQLPPETHPLALPRCRNAIEALSAFAAGFAPQTASGLLKVTRPNGSEAGEISLDAATHTYLRLVRNAGTHSFRKAVRDPYQRSILASHEGDIPDAIADLAFFHLLRLLARPYIPTLGQRVQSAAST